MTLCTERILAGHQAERTRRPGVRWVPTAVRLGGAVAAGSAGRLGRRRDRETPASRRCLSEAGRRTVLPSRCHIDSSWAPPSGSATFSGPEPLFQDVMEGDLFTQVDRVLDLLCTKYALGLIPNE